MKTKFFILFLFSVFLVGCSNDEDTNENASGKVVIDLATINPIQLKSIYSQEATNRVTSVTLYAFKSDGSGYNLEKTYNVSGWALGTTFKRYEIPAGEEPTAGDYIFMAVGEEEKSEYVFDQKERLADFRAILEKKVGTTEFFAGSSTQVQVLSTGARVSLEMKRKVSGIMGYFSNVPKEMNGKEVGHLRLIAKRLNIVENVNTAVGDKTDESENIILDFDLQKQGIDPTLDVFTGNDISGVKVAKLKNTQLGGAYLLPIDKTVLTLRLYETDGTTIIREWPVLYKGEEGFELRPNYLYTLGVKPTTAGTKGDEPIDLMKNFVVALTLNPNWDGLGDLTIKD